MSQLNAIAGKALIAHLPEAAVLISDGMIDGWNSAAHDLYGWRAQDAVGQEVINVIPVVRYFGGQTPQSALAQLNQYGVWSGRVVQQHRAGYEVVVDMTATAIDDLDGPVRNLLVLCRDLRDPATAGSAHVIWQSLTADVVETLNRVPDERSMVANLIRYLVPGVADWCRVDLALDSGADQRATGYYDRSRHMLAGEIYGETAPPTAHVYPVAAAQVLSDLTQERLVLLAQDAAEYQRISGLNLQSALHVPLTVGGQVLGMLTLGAARTRPSYTQEDLHGAQQLANSVALAIAYTRHSVEVQRERNKLHELRRLAIDLQEKERGKVARDLHDEIGQLLTGLGMLLDVEANTELPNPRIIQARHLVDDLLQCVRGFAGDLQPAMLTDFGLGPTLAWLVERWTVQTGIHVHLAVNGIGRRFDQAVELTAYRIVQEALTNVARHANCNAADVTVNLMDGHLRITVEDHGVGFDVRAGETRMPSSGLAGMIERTVSVGGHLSVTSWPEQGTRIEADLPLESPVLLERNTELSTARQQVQEVRRLAAELRHDVHNLERDLTDTHSTASRSHAALSGTSITGLGIDTTALDNPHA